MWWWALVACGTRSPPDVLVVTLDTTRADAVGVYGQAPSPTPNLDALGARGARVDEALSVTPLTLPAHTSMFTGLYPDAHGVRDNLSSPLDPSFDTLAEELKAHGYRTGAFVGAVVLDAMFGLEQGFEVYEDGFDLTNRAVPGDPIVQWPADVVEGRAERWIRDVAKDDAPFFAWVHFYDAHQPATPPEAFARRFPEDPYLARSRRRTTRWDGSSRRCTSSGATGTCWCSSPGTMGRGEGTTASACTACSSIGRRCTCRSYWSGRASPREAAS